MILLGNAPETRSGERQVQAVQTLSTTLKVSTASAHCAVERALALPQSIRNQSDYIACLRRFYRLYRPLEARLAAFDAWPDLSIDLASKAQAPRLARDLLRLEQGASLPGDAETNALPPLPSFDHALGALYVLEGSSLGGVVINRALRAARIDGVGESCAFFAGIAPREKGSWPDFRSILDDYGRTRVKACGSVITGAEDTFLAIERWMAVRHWGAA